MLNWYKNTIQDILLLIKNRKTLDKNEFETIITLIQKDYEKVKSIVIPYIQKYNFIYVKSLLKEESINIFENNYLIDKLSENNNCLSIVEFNKFYKDFNNIESSCGFKYNNVQNLELAINKAFDNLSVLNNIFIQECKDCTNTELGIEEYIDSESSPVKLLLFKNEFELEKYYLFFQDLSTRYVDLSTDLTIIDESSLVKFVNIITYAVVYNTLFNEFYMVIKSLVEKNTFRTDTEYTVDYITANNNIDLSIESYNDYFIQSMEDKEVEKMVNKASKAVDKATDDSRTTAEEMGDKKAGLLKRIKDKISKVPVQCKTAINKMRLFLHNRKSTFTYKKVLGKIDGLYDFYADKAFIDETRFKGDPVLILKNTICPNIIRIGKEMAKLADETEGMLKKCGTMSTKESVIELGEKWARKLPDLTLAGEKMEELNLKQRIKYSTRTRMVDILMKEPEGLKIYGFTRESMIVKALPPVNHYLVSMILVNPQERPQNMSVSEIFEGPDSFRIMANAEKGDIFQIGELMNVVLANKLNAETFQRIEDRLKQTQSKFKGMTNSDDSEQNKETDKLYKQALDGFKDSVEILAKQKIYISDMINVYGNLIMRIDALSIRAVRQLQYVEAENADPRYKMGKGNATMKKTAYTTQMANKYNQ